ncbi:hypothetical protein L6R52_36595 [Myxococcota bacterium]|nr:hypothetical protein [Myxococcota bacterium]
MPIDIVPYTKEHEPAVAAFNQRLAGTGWGWYEDSIPDWIPKRDPEQKAWREYWVAVEDKVAVRAAYALKPQEWLIRGETKIVTDWQGPVSEGLVDKKYGLLVLRLLRDMLKKRPLLYSWGHGGHDSALPTLLRSVGGWLLYDTPICLFINKPSTFLRENKFLRTDDKKDRMMNVAAATGVGWAAFKAAHAAMSLRGLPRRRGARASAHVVERFDEWADDVWARSKDRYSAIGVRDRKTMNLMVPQGHWPNGTKVQVKRGTDVVGWAVVLDNKHYGDVRFGDMRVGSIVDVLAEPEDAVDVVAAAHEVLLDRGVDMIMSNQSHPIWADAFGEVGYFVVPNKRLFAASPELWKALEPFEETKTGLHLTNMDGHGPHAM